MIAKKIIKSKNGNNLACLIANPKGKSEGVVISSHGFLSTNKSGTYTFLLEELPKINLRIIILVMPTLTG